MEFSNSSMNSRFLYARTFLNKRFPQFSRFDVANLEPRQHGLTALEANHHGEDHVPWMDNNSGKKVRC